MHEPTHILTQMGVLTSFSVAKKITEEDVEAFFKKYRKSGKTEEEIGIILREKIFEEIRIAMESKSIPGLLNPLTILNSKMGDMQHKNIVEINRLMSIVSQKLIEKKYDKFSLCYFINALVNSLGLTEKDFTSFHRKISGQSETHGDTIDEEDIDDDEDEDGDQ